MDILAVFIVQLDKIGCFLDTRRTPGGPKVKNNGLVKIVLELMGFTVKSF